MVGNGTGALSGLFFCRPFCHLIQAGGIFAYPSLVITGHQAGFIYLCNNGHRTGNFRRLALGAAHAAQTGGNKQPAGQIFLLGDTQFQPASVQQGVKGAMDNALGADIHPAAGGHLPIVGNAQCRRPIKSVQIVKQPHHQAVCDDNPRGGFVGSKQPYRVPRFHNQGLLVGKLFQIFFNQPVLHPILADLTGFPVGNQLVRIERHLKIQVVIDHHLKGFSFLYIRQSACPSTSLPDGSGNRKYARAPPAPGQTLSPSGHGDPDGYNAEHF